MTVAALMLVKDEADMIDTTVRHLLRQVDRVYVADNLSSDGTLDILKKIAGVNNGRLRVERDLEVGYRQAEKTTALARKAVADGADWVVPVDADEVWYSPFGRLGDVLDALPPEFLFATGTILNHVGTDLDDPREPDPVKRLGYRVWEPGELPKVAARAIEDLRIGMGNHDASGRGRVDSRTAPTIHGQIYIHHYPWRSEEQFLRKITNGALAYAAAPDVGEEYGGHWRAFGMPGDPGFIERVVGWYREWGRRYGVPPEPVAGESDLVYDPAVIQQEGTW